MIFGHRKPIVVVIERLKEATKIALRKGTREVATAYLEHLYAPESQEIIAKNYYRPRDSHVLEKYSKVFPNIPSMVTIADFGGWAKVQAKHFNDGGVFDKVTAP